MQRRRRYLGIILRIVIVSLALLLILLAISWFTFWSSLPTIDGSLKAQPLKSSVRIERDALGVVTIHASSQLDAVFALGYAHGQDRRFQMDLLRRSAAGELAEIIGKAALDLDKKVRVHRFRSVAQSVFLKLSPPEQTLLKAYAEGVNLATDSLRVSAPEYVLLSTTPSAWLPEESFLVVLAMFLQLQDQNAQRKIQRGMLYDSLPKEVADFVYSEARANSAALDGSVVPGVPIPEEHIYNLRKDEKLRVSPPVTTVNAGTNAMQIGASNNWAVSGKRTANKSAIIANDMHLGLRVPNTWYRARIVIEGDSDVTGVTLPGIPFVVVGSNGKIAWSFTNSTADFQSVVVAVPDPKDPNRYLTSNGSVPFGHVRERIKVKGEQEVDLDVVTTKWGPVIGHDATDRKYALEWTAHKAEALNIELSKLATAKSTKEALQIAARSGMPNQNFVVGDSEGHIGWTISGQIPKRAVGDFSRPHLSTEAEPGFIDWVAPENHPLIIDPDSGQIATANSRPVGGAALELLGDGGYDRGVRAKRIQTLLASKIIQAPADSLAIQLDDDAAFLRPWHLRLQAALDDDAIKANPKRKELKDLMGRFSGHAAVDDAAYTAVRVFRTQVERHVYYALVAKLREKNPTFEFRIPNSFEGPLTALVDKQPLHLLQASYATWRDLFLKAVDATIADIEKVCESVTLCRFGVFNRVHIQHPMSQALPLVGRLFDMPKNEISGDHDTPKVIAPHFGASERLVVSVGHESESYFHMPTGQSGHFFSPFYRAGHEAWVNGEPTPFLPGRAEHTLTLSP